MHIHFNMSVLGLGRDLLQSVSTFYRVVKKNLIFNIKIFDRFGFPECEDSWKFDVKMIYFVNYSIKSAQNLYEVPLQPQAI